MEPSGNLPEPYAASNRDDLASLDVVFTLPVGIENPMLVQMYEVLVHRMRREAQHLPMSTVQQLLIERIAMAYVVLRAREIGAMEGFAHATEAKNANSFWLSMVEEFNQILRSKAPETQLANESHEASLRLIRDVVVNVISSSVPVENRKSVMENLANAFADVGL
jgi:hypothetical protein